MDYHNPFYKKVRYSDEYLSDDNALSGEQIIFPPISGPGQGQRPPQPGPGPRPPQPGPGPGPRPPQPGPPQPGPVSPPSQPMAPPPNFIPELPSNANAQGPEAFRLGGQVGGSSLWICLNRYTYMWLFNGRNFWFFPTFIGRNHVEGFRWRRNSWVYERINLRLIFFFLCF